MAFKKGHIPWNKDKKRPPFSEEWKRRMSEGQKGKKLAENNPNWKGNDVGYTGLHDWVGKKLPKPELCECCNEKPPFDLCNISGEYKRDLDNWEWLCRKCHMTKDGRMKNLEPQHQKRKKLRICLYCKKSFIYSHIKVKHCSSKCASLNVWKKKLSNQN